MVVNMVSVIGELKFISGELTSKFVSSKLVYFWT